MEENAFKSNFKCAFCGKSFPRNFNLKRHLKSKHAVEHKPLNEGEIFKEFVDFSGK